MGCSSSADGSGGFGSGSCMRLQEIIELTEGDRRQESGVRSQNETGATLWLTAESELMAVQIHAPAAKGDALHFQ
jgi:hypothetical protein